jgi:uncharacterized protein
MAFSPAQLSFGGHKGDGLPAQCLACDSLGLCNGGCPKDRFVDSADGEPGLNYLCQGLRRFFTYATPMVDELVRLQAARVPVGLLGVRMREAQAARWRDVGRNDPCLCGSGRKAKGCCWHRRP